MTHDSQRIVRSLMGVSEFHENRASPVLAPRGEDRGAEAHRSRQKHPVEDHGRARYRAARPTSVARGMSAGMPAEAR